MKKKIKKFKKIVKWDWKSLIIIPIICLVLAFVVSIGIIVDYFNKDFSSFESYVGAYIISGIFLIGYVLSARIFADSHWEEIKK